MPRSFLATMCWVAIAFSCNALAADPQADTPNKDEARKPMIKKAIKVHEPMQGHMKNDGMVKGDMKVAAAKKEADMKGIIQQEEKAMPQGDPKK